jgi:hypothetical protein
VLSVRPAAIAISHGHIVYATSTMRGVNVQSGYIAINYFNKITIPFFCAGFLALQLVGIYPNTYACILRVAADSSIPAFTNISASWLKGLPTLAKHFRL